MADYGSFGVYRVTWDVAPDSESKAQDLIALARGYAVKQLSLVPGVNFVVSAFTGITNNAKRKKTDDGASSVTVRPGISFIVQYIPHVDGGEEKLRDSLNRIGLTINPNETGDLGTLKELGSRGKGDTKQGLVQRCCNSLKDHNSAYASKLLADSLAHCKRIEPSCDLCPTTVEVICCNVRLVPLLQHLTKELKSVGVPVTLNTNAASTTNIVQHYGGDSKGIDLSVRIVADFLRRKKLALKAGFVYKMPAGAQVTYVRCASVETFINVIMGSVDIVGRVSVGHIKQLVSVFAHPDCAIYPQIEIDQDLIEVSGGMCWHLSNLQFVKTPIGEDDVGRKTPRAFARYDHRKSPHPHHFINTITNSFPDTNERLLFLTKWYHLALAHRHVMKLKKLMVVGKKNCGKTTLVNPLLNLIDEEKVASLTKEAKFATSMITADTQLVFVDEFSEQFLDPSQAKMIIQGGRTVTAVKSKTARMMHQTCMFYFTANQVPDWGEEDDNVKERLMIFQMAQLTKLNKDVAQWLLDHWFECILWAGVTILRGKDSIPAEEFAFNRNSLVIRKETQRLNELKDMVLQPFVVEPPAKVDKLFDDDDDDGEEVIDFQYNRFTICPGDYDDAEGAGTSAFAPQCSQGSFGITPPPSPGSFDPFNDLQPGFSGNNPFANMHKVDSIPSDVLSDAEDASDLEECTLDTHSLTMMFTKESVSSDPQYLRVVRRVIEDNLQIPGLVTPNPTHYANFLRLRENKLKAARTSYLRRHYAGQSLQKRSIRLQQLIDDKEEVYDDADVLFDAWSVVTGQCRSIFHPHKLFRRYPSLINRVKRLREQMKITLQCRDTNAELQKDVAVVLRRLVDDVTSEV